MTSFEVIEKIKEVLYTEYNSLRALVKISKLIAAWEAQEKQENTKTYYSEFDLPYDITKNYHVVLMHGGIFMLEPKAESEG